MRSDEFLTDLRGALGQDHDDGRWTVPENRLRQARISYGQTHELNDELEVDEIDSLIVDHLLTAGATSFTGGPNDRGRLHATYMSKATWLSDRPCTTCDIAAPGMSVSMQLPIDPFSAQIGAETLRSRKARLRAGLASMYPESGLWPKCVHVCLRVVCVLSAHDRDKDADNLVKGVLDSLQSVLYENDASIGHLEVFKLSTRASRGFYLVSARPVEVLTSDVLDVRRELSWHPSPGWTNTGDTIGIH